MKVVVDFESMNNELSNCLKKAVDRIGNEKLHFDYLCSTDFDRQNLINNPIKVPVNQLIKCATTLGVQNELCQIIINSNFK
jgi:hypothetical protein